MNNSVYLESLEFKLKSANYHFNQTLLAIHNIVFKSEEEQLVAVSSEFTAMMLTFQSSFDVLGQLINAKILKAKLKGKFYFYNVIEESAIMDQELRSKLLEIDKSEITIYLRDFCNTIKHRNIIKIVVEPELYPSENLYPSPNLFTGRQFVIDRFVKSKTFSERNIISQLELTFYYFERTFKEIINYIKNNY